MRYNKYDVIYGEFPDRDCSIQSGYRPGIVIQNNIGRTYNIFTYLNRKSIQKCVDGLSNRKYRIRIVEEDEEV